MAELNVTFANLGAIKKAGQRVADEIDVALRRTADFVRHDITRQIVAEVTPSGSPQKQNSPAYRRWKLERYGTGKPLVREGRLSNPDAMRVVRIQNGYQVLPPADREDVLRFVRQMGYETYGLSRQALQRAFQEYREAIARAGA